MLLVYNGWGTTYICAVPRGQSTDAKLPVIPHKVRSVHLKGGDEAGKRNTNQYMSPAMFSL
jgi:hypothetical protein